MIAVLPFTMMLGWGCASSSQDTGFGECDSTDPTAVVVVTELTFARRDGNVSVGFDLDGHVTDAGDDEGCNQADLVAPDGTEGIDNALSALIPALEATEAAAVEGLVQDAINTGEILLIFELEDVDDLSEDDCVSMNIIQGAGTPMIGSEGTILSGQTFDRDLESPTTRLEGLEIVCGAVSADSFEMILPFQIFDVLIEFELNRGALHLELDRDGNFSGYLGGGVPIAEMVEVAETQNVDDEVRQLVTDLVTMVADMAPDENGVCQQISLVLEFKGTWAFLFED